MKSCERPHAHAGLHAWARKPRRQQPKKPEREPLRDTPSNEMPSRSPGLIL
jgi:hypothetical protein